jgi:hypothetical protein
MLCRLEPVATSGRRGELLGVSGVIHMPSQNIERACAVAVAYALRPEQHDLRVMGPMQSPWTSTPATITLGSSPLITPDLVVFHAVSVCFHGVIHRFLGWISRVPINFAYAAYAGVTRPIPTVALDLWRIRVEQTDERPRCVTHAIRGALLSRRQSLTQFLANRESH